MKTKTIGVGIIGVGRISHAHELGYQQAPEKVRIVAICDLDEAAARQRAEPYGAAVYTDYRALLEDPRVEVVDIILPHSLHHPVALDAIAHKKHVSVEKPLAVSSAQALALCESAKREGVKLTVAENTRFVTAYIEANRFIKEGVLGELRLVRTFISGSEVYRLQLPTNWKGRREGSSGGAIMDAGPHSFYLLKWLAGGVRELQAFQSRLVEESEVEDNAVVSGILEGGTVFTTQYSFTAEAPWDERLEVYGSKGSLIIDQLCNPPARHFRGARDFEPRPLSDVPYDPVGWKRHSIAVGVADFVQAIWDDRPPTVDPMDAHYTLRVIEKAYESIATGRVAHM